MMCGFNFKLLARKGFARAGELATPHGVIRTPVFMPVGTVGSVKAVSPDDLEMLGAQIILGNTYHLYLRPGDELVKDFGGLHGFMNWQKPILTDSGGFQVSSLGHFRDRGETALKRGLKRTQIDDDGVTFWSHIDGSQHRLTPEKSMEIQKNLGSDIIMAFDEATPDKGKDYAREAMERTHKWLVRSKKRWQELEEEKGVQNPEFRIQRLPQALFGIIQGDRYEDLRKESAEFVINQDLPGVTLGGGSVGQSPQETEENISWVRKMIPKEKPFSLLGVGVGPEDAVAAVLSGADMFDCVAPTRIARMGGLYCGELKFNKTIKKSVLDLPKFVSEFEKGRLNIDNRRFKDDRGVIDEQCDCYTCQQGFSRGYLRHLFVTKELLYYRLASIHNLRMMVRVMEQMRQWILANPNPGK